MKLNKDDISKLASLPDDALWKEVHSIAKAHGINLPEPPPKKEDMDKLRAILSDPDKINMFKAMKLINDYKRGSK